MMNVQLKHYLNVLLLCKKKYVLMNQYSISAVFSAEKQGNVSKTLEIYLKYSKIFVCNNA